MAVQIVILLHYKTGSGPAAPELYPFRVQDTPILILYSYYNRFASVLSIEETKDHKKNEYPPIQAVETRDFYCAGVHILL